MWKLFLHKWQMTAAEKQPKAPQWEIYPGFLLAQSSHVCEGVGYLSGSHLVAIWVHGG